MRISEWSSDVCSSDLQYTRDCAQVLCPSGPHRIGQERQTCKPSPLPGKQISFSERAWADRLSGELAWWKLMSPGAATHLCWRDRHCSLLKTGFNQRSEEHTSELQSLMRISYAVFCLQTKNNILLTHMSKNYKHNELHTTS